MLKITKVFLMALAFQAIIASADQIKIKNIEKIKQAIVTIDSRVSVSAYKNTGGWSGTGFITDLDRGFIITNNHVVGRAAVGTYFVTFHNGQQAEAKVAYYDQYADFAILKVLVSDLPKEVEKIEFSVKEPRVGEEIFIIGNTEGQGFSFHNGYLSDLFEINGEMPQGSYVINMNSTGGASGSPVIDSGNKAIGVLYGGGKTHALALKSSYVTEVLKALKDNKPVRRQHVGIITRLYSLDKAVKHRNFPKTKMDYYINKFPDARNRVIEVHSIIPGSSAQNILIAGDILWAVNKKELAGDLTILDRAMNESKDIVYLTIFRNGEKLDMDVKLYDLEKTKIHRMIDFAGAIFFEIDDFVAAKSGMPISRVGIVNVEAGSSFSSIPQMFIQDNKSIYRLVLNSLNNNKINNLDNLMKVIKESVIKKFINVIYTNFQPFYPAFNPDSGFISSQDEMMQDITFDSIDTKPRMLKYDGDACEWKSEDL